MNVVRAGALRVNDMVHTAGPLSAYGLVSVARVASVEHFPTDVTGTRWVHVAVEPIPVGPTMNLTILADAPVLLAADELVREEAS